MGTQYFICGNQLGFMFFKSHALSAQLHHFTREELIASWLYHDLKFKTPQAEEFAVHKIYDATSTASVPHSNSSLITQEPSNLLVCSCSNRSLLFIKSVTMNRRVLSEWQFNFRRLHYGPPIPSNVNQCSITCEGVSIDDIFINSNTLYQPPGLRLLLKNVCFQVACLSFWLFLNLFLFLVLIHVIIWERSLNLAVWLESITKKCKLIAL